MNELLNLRKAKKAKKPTFKTQDSWKRKRIPKSWRRPKGLHSKMRLKFKGNPKLPSQGYRSPAEVRGMHGSGLKTVFVTSLKQMDSVNAEGIILASALGAKKKREIIKKAAEKKLKIVNLDVAKYLKKTEKAVHKKKQEANAKKPESEPAAAETKKDLEKTEKAVHKKEREANAKKPESEPAAAETKKNPEKTESEQKAPEKEKSSAATQEENRKKSVKEAEKIITKRG